MKQRSRACLVMSLVVVMLTSCVPGEPTGLSDELPPPQFMMHGAPTEVGTVVLVGGNFGGVSVDPVVNKVFVSNVFNAASVEAIDPNSLTSLGVVGASNAPFNLAADPLLGRVFVATGNSVLVLDAALGAVGSVAFPAFGVAVNTSTSRVYATRLFPAEVLQIDGNSLAAINSSPLGGSPCGFSLNCVAVNEATNRVYIVDFTGATVSVLNGSTLGVIASVPVGAFPTGIAVDPGLNQIYVSTFSAVQVIDGATNTIIAGFAPPAVPGGFLGNIAVSPLTHRVYVAERLSPGRLFIIDGLGLSVVTTVPLSISVAAQLDVHPSLARVFVRSGLGNLLSVVQDHPPVIQVSIDIKPGSDPNSINCNNANETITVVLLTTDDFDGTTVDHATVTFDGASETHVHKKTGEPRRHEEDVDGDGDTDLLFHFMLGDTQLDCSSAEGTLTGETFDGRSIEGTDAVRMIGG